jgi:hypothetical protein
VYELAQETFFIEDLKTSLMLPMKTAYKDALREVNSKKDLWEDFYTTEAMTNRKLTETNYQMRHVINRIAVHGPTSNSAVKLDSMNTATNADVNCARPHVKDTI